MDARWKEVVRHTDVFMSLSHVRKCRITLKLKYNELFVSSWKDNVEKQLKRRRKRERKREGKIEDRRKNSED